MGEIHIWTHTELIDRAARWLRHSARVYNLTSNNRPISARCGVVLTEHYGGMEKPDAIGWCRGGNLSIVIECKTSRADFLADFQKISRRAPRQGVGMYRFYMAPVGVITHPTAVEAGWGILEVCSRTVQVIQQSREHPFSTRVEKAMLWSACRKLQTRMRPN